MSIYKQLIYGEREKFWKEVKLLERPDCYLALQAARARRIRKAKYHLSKCNFEELRAMEQAVVLETMSLLSFSSMHFKEAKENAKQALSINEKMFFSRMALARIAEIEKDFNLAASYYHLLSDAYPNHSDVQLCIAQNMLVRKYDYSEILKIVRGASLSSRKFLYLLLIPFGKALARLCLLIILLVLFASTWGTGLFWGTLVVVFVIQIYSVLKIDWDNLILTRTFSIQIVILLAKVLAEIMKAAAAV